MQVAVEPPRQEAFWKHIGRKLAPILRNSGSVFEVLGGLGAILEVLGWSWRHLGRSWSQLGRSWSHLGCSWAVLGRRLEAKLADLKAILAGLDGQVGALEANLDASWSQHEGDFGTPWKKPLRESLRELFGSLAGMDHMWILSGFLSGSF